MIEKEYDFTGYHEAQLIQGLFGQKYDTLINLLNNIQKQKLKNIIDIYLKGLDYRNCEIVKLFYGIDEIFPFSIEEIENVFNINSECIELIKDESLCELKNLGLEKRLDEFFGIKR